MFCTRLPPNWRIPAHQRILSLPTDVAGTENHTKLNAPSWPHLSFITEGSVPTFMGMKPGKLPSPELENLSTNT